METSRYYLGLATTFHDSALAIVSPEGDLLFAEATERPTQIKRALCVPPESVLVTSGTLEAHIPSGSEIVIATSWGPTYSDFLARLGRRNSARDVRGSASTAITTQLTQIGTDRAFLAALRSQQDAVGFGTQMALAQSASRSSVVEVRRYEHHRTHAKYGIYASGSESGTCVVIDGMGESGAISAFGFEDGCLEELKLPRTRFSPGFFYGLLTDLAGFKQIHGEEWKLMGLAAFGQQTPLVGKVRQLLNLSEGFPFTASEDAVNQAIKEIRHERSDTLNEGWADLALAAQIVFTEIINAILASTLEGRERSQLVLTGGCALNSSFNGTVERTHGIDRLFVPSAPADDGNAIGAALLAFQDDLPPKKSLKRLKTALSPYSGSDLPSPGRLQMLLGSRDGAIDLGTSFIGVATELLCAGAVMGWMQGRAEFGPRALGNRSILMDPRGSDAKRIINSKVKYRESFRPFAPAILAECGSDWFEDFQPSPYMERTLRWKAGSHERVPAVVHADYTGRLQTVTKSSNPIFYELIASFGSRTGIPILLNTSLNVMGKPIVHDLADALTVLHTTDLDCLFIGTWMIAKTSAHLGRALEVASL
jgi:carbamoyltransferase